MKIDRACYERGCACYDDRIDKDLVEVVKREWVGLTDEEIKECFKITPDQFLPWQIYQRIEAKLKEKNT